MQSTLENLRLFKTESTLNGVTVYSNVATFSIDDVIKSVSNRGVPEHIRIRDATKIAQGEN